MLRRRPFIRLHRWALCGTLGTLLAFPVGACRIGEFTSTSTITLNSRDVVLFILNSLIVDPIAQAVSLGVDRWYDSFEEEG